MVHVEYTLSKIMSVIHRRISTIHCAIIVNVHAIVTVTTKPMYLS
ncbi:hypothetical protein V12B01_13100 [Vibrio splendidus 12B01]|nr:hypothetical protein V12B01_13100 [Vibrio splendidus 12B01]